VIFIESSSSSSDSESTTGEMTIDNKPSAVEMVQVEGENGLEIAISVNIDTSPDPGIVVPGNNENLTVQPVISEEIPSSEVEEFTEEIHPVNQTEDITEEVPPVVMPEESSDDSLNGDSQLLNRTSDIENCDKDEGNGDDGKENKPGALIQVEDIQNCQLSNENCHESVNAKISTFDHIDHHEPNLNEMQTPAFEKSHLESNASVSTDTAIPMINKRNTSRKSVNFLANCLMKKALAKSGFTPKSPPYSIDLNLLNGEIGQESGLNLIFNNSSRKEL